MKDNNILVDGKDADWFAWESVGCKPNKKISPENMLKLEEALKNSGGINLNKGSLTAIKASLESDSGRASDFTQQNQLKIQQLIQNFNTAITMANSIQSMAAESNKSIAQSIR